MSNIPQLDEALESITAIREANAAARKAEDAAIAAKEVYQTRKKTRDAAISELQRIIEEHTKPLSLFASAAETRAKSTETARPGVSGAPDDESTGPAPTIDPGANTDAWKHVQLSAVPGLSGKLATKLAEAGLATLGALAGHTARGGRLFDLPGIGEKTAEKIEQALEDYWAEAKKAAGSAEAVEPEAVPNPVDAASKSTAWAIVKLASILPAEVARALEADGLVDLLEVQERLSCGVSLEDLAVPAEAVAVVRRALVAARWDHPGFAGAVPFDWLARPAMNEADRETALAELCQVERDLSEERRQAKPAEPEAVA